MGGLKNETGMVDDIFLADDDGNIRGIITTQKDIDANKNNIIADYVNDFIVYKGNVYYNISLNTIAKVNNNGEIDDLFVFEGYTKHHDFKVYDDKIFLLASENDANTEEDLILIYDINSHEIEKVIDLKEVFPEIYEKCQKERFAKDWIHINSIDIRNDKMLISSRELSSVIELTNFYEEPKIEYIIGPEEIYEDTNLKDKVLNKASNFEIQLGQHTAFYLDECKIGLYNNAYAYSYVIYWIDWKKYKESDKSFYYEYDIKKDKNEFELKQCIEVPYSQYMSGSSKNEKNIIIYSRKSKYFGEFLENGNKVQEFELNIYCYRIKKYNFKNFWFQ